MTFGQKLARLTADQNRAKLSRAAGLPANAISDYINKDYRPRIEIGVALARQLKVPLDWLADDKQEWPPPVASSATAGLTTEQLAGELGRRLGGVGSVMLAKLHRAEKVDWLATARELLEAPPDKPLPQRLRDLIDLPGAISLLTAELLRFNPSTLIDDVPADLRDAVHPGYYLSLVELWQRESILTLSAGYTAAAELAQLWSIPEKLRPAWFAEALAQERATWSDQLSDASARSAEVSREQLAANFNNARFADEGEPVDAVRRKRQDDRKPPAGKLKIDVSIGGRTRRKPPKKR